MRIDHNLLVFINHPDWYILKEGVGFIPTPKAPKEAVKAMENYNYLNYTNPKKR